MNIGIITGASSGIGEEFVRQLAHKYRGLDEIWVIARRFRRIEALSKSVKCQTGVTVVPIAMDLLDMGRIVELGEMLKTEKPDVRILINAAGFGKIGPFSDQRVDDMSGMIQVNTVALTAITRMVLPYMPEKSRMIQVASAAAFLPQPYSTVYAATKAYVYSFSRALNAELRRRRITVTAVCPGPVKTEFFQVASPSSAPAAYKRFFYAEAKDVVKKALSDCAAGKRESVYGVSMNLLKKAAKILPWEMLIRIAEFMQ